MGCLHLTIGRPLSSVPTTRNCAAYRTHRHPISQAPIWRHTMDGQMRLAALVLGLLFLLGIATVVISSNLFNYTPFRTASEITTDPDTDALLSTRKHTPRSNRIQLATGEQDSVATRAQLARLEVLLKERTVQLEDRNGRVDELNSQLRQLRSNTAARPSARPAGGRPARRGPASPAGGI